MSGLIQLPRAQAVEAAGDSDLSRCLSRWVDRSGRIASNGRANLHRGLIPETPVKAQGIRSDELHETLLPHAIVVVIRNQDVPKLLLWWGLDGVSALSEAVGTW